MERSIELPRHTRTAELRASSFNADENTVDVIFTTGAIVRRNSYLYGAYDEELIVTPDSVRLDRLNAGAPFLNAHSDWDLSDVIGCIVPGSARIVKGQGLATIKLSSAPSDADNVQKIKDGIIRNVSSGYLCHRIEKIESDAAGAVALWRVVDWEPMEVSAVPMGADPGAQMRAEAADKTRLFGCVITEPDAQAVVSPINSIRTRMRMRARAHELAR